MRDYICVFIDAHDGTGQCYQCGETRSQHQERETAASNPQEQASTTAKTLTKENCECEDCLKEERERATSEWYDDLERKYRLVDEGQTFNGEGESYASRNA
jgi:protein subunit release factor B